MSVKSISPVGIQELGGLPEHPLQTLARAARMMNPGQMDIPKSFIPHIQLPGESNLLLFLSNNSIYITHDKYPALCAVKFYKLVSTDMVLWW